MGWSAGPTTSAEHQPIGVDLESQLFEMCGIVVEALVEEAQHGAVGVPIPTVAILNER